MKLTIRSAAIFAFNAAASPSSGDELLRNIAILIRSPLKSARLRESFACSYRLQENENDKYTEEAQADNSESMKAGLNETEADKTAQKNGKPKQCV